MANEVISIERLNDYNDNMLRDANVLKRSTAYTLNQVVCKGQVVLKCSQAGTTNSTTLSLSGVAVDDELTDGTAKWKVISITGYGIGGGGTGAGLEDWESNHNYAVDDIYVYEGEIYKTLIAFTSGATEDSRTKVNNIVPFVWTANTVYTAGDIIEHTDVTTLKKVYYNVTANFTSGATFEVTAEMQELQIVEEYVPNPLTKQQVKNLIRNFVPSGSGSGSGVYAETKILWEGLFPFSNSTEGSSPTSSTPKIELNESIEDFDYIMIVSGLDDEDNITKIFPIDYMIPMVRIGLVATSSFYATAVLAMIDNTHFYIRWRNVSGWVEGYVKSIQGIKFISSPNNYSTEEQRIGTWIDGKPLYQRTYNFTNVGGGLTELATIDSNIVPVGIKSYGSFRSGSLLSIPYYQSSIYNLYIDIDNYKLRCGNYWESTGITLVYVYITIQYTKTTD